jgi:hypothetical protein
MGKILRRLQEHIKHWTKPVTPVLIIVILSDLTCSHTDLVVENALLRKQLIMLNRQIKQPQLTNPVILKKQTELTLDSQEKSPVRKFLLKIPINQSDEASGQHKAS